MSQGAPGKVFAEHSLGTAILKGLPSGIASLSAAL